jgi:hypothetical protein
MGAVRYVSGAGEDDSSDVPQLDLPFSGAARHQGVAGVVTGVAPGACGGPNGAHQGCAGGGGFGPPSTLMGIGGRPAQQVSLRAVDGQVRRVSISPWRSTSSATTLMLSSRGEDNDGHDQGSPGPVLVDVGDQ